MLRIFIYLKMSKNSSFILVLNERNFLKHMYTINEATCSRRTDFVKWKKEKKKEKENGTEKKNAARETTGFLESYDFYLNERLLGSDRPRESRGSSSTRSPNRWSGPLSPFLSRGPAPAAWLRGTIFIRLIKSANGRRNIVSWRPFERCPADRRY